MSKITNINNAPMISAKEATLVALKDGKLARTTLNELITVIEEVQGMNVDELKTNFETIKSNFSNVESYLKTVEKRLSDLEKTVDSMFTTIQSGEAVVEPAEEAPKTKTTKKSKKVIESAE